jgi:ABC-2 type transport system ATP-binding protein
VAAAALARIEGLHYAYAAKGKAAGSTALAGITAQIEPGVITGLAGPDGAGKTTLLRLLAGLLRPSAGRITVLGHDMAREAAVVHQSIGYMPQRFGLYEDLTVAENFSLFGQLHGIAAEAREARMAMLLRFTGLAPFTTRLAGKLSGGMKQKLGLACALLARPRLLLLDEPSVGVDPASRRELWGIVERMLAEDESAGAAMGVVWATSYLDEAERCASVLLLHEGQLLSAAPPRDFLAPLAGRVFRAAVPAAGRRQAVAAALRVENMLDATVQGDSLRLVLRRGGGPEPARAAGFAMTPAAPRFEDGYVDVLAALAPPARPGAMPLPAPAGAAGAARPVIEVSGLVKRFGDFTAVDDANFSIGRGEIFGLLGPNGAGKSTIFRMLCGLLRPSGGQARVAGQDLLTAAAAARARIGYMAQRFSLYGELTIRQNLNFFARVYGLDRTRAAQAIAAALGTFDLQEEAETLAGALPLGLKQRLSLAAALLHGPEILFLDEPTSGVDPLTRRAFWARIGALADAGVTVLVTSHFMDEAEYCDRLAIVNAGRIVVTGTPADLRARVRTAALPDPTLEDAFIALTRAPAAVAA